MKSSTIKLVINKKVSNWINTIDSEIVKKAVKKDTIVAGGCIASMLAGEKVNDYDIYFRTFETAKLVAEYYADKFNKTAVLQRAKHIADTAPEVKVKSIVNIKGETEQRIIFYMKSSGVASEAQSESQTVYEYFESKSEVETAEFLDGVFDDSVTANPKDPVTLTEEILVELKSKKEPYRPVFFSDNAVTLSDKVQLIIRFYGEPDKILNNYDYAHSMCYYDYYKDHLQLHHQALECILSKTLVYHGSLYPIASLFRIRKFIERGWRITAGQMLKIIWQLSEIDLKDPETIREQLIGVDQAYMTQLITALSNHEGRVDSAYIAQLVDKIFE